MNPPIPTLPAFAPPPVEVTEGFDWRTLLARYVRWWPLFVLSVGVALTGAFFYNRYATPVYSISATMLLKDARGGNSMDALEGLPIFKSSQNIQNEIGIMGSRMVAELTLKQLNFDVSYFADGNVKVSEMFAGVPFRVTYDSTHAQLWGQLFSMEVLNDQQFVLQLETEESSGGWLTFGKGPAYSAFLKGNYTFGQEIVGEGYRFTVNKTPSFSPQRRVYQFRLNTLDALVSGYAGRVRVAPVNKSATLVVLSLDTPTPAKDMVYLNKFAEMYVRTGLDEKNLIARNTIAFINQQLGGVADSLDVVEDRMQSFRAANGIIDLTVAGTQAFEKFKTLDERKGQQSLRRSYYTSLLDYIARVRNAKEAIAPSSIGIQDPITTALITQLIEIYAKRSALTYNATAENPYVAELDEKIKALTNSLEENARTALTTLAMESAELEQRIRLTENELAQLPEKERKKVGIQRKVTLNQNLYTFLLQKRAESEISKASNVPDSKVIDAARVMARIFPTPEGNYMKALMAGLLLPLVFVLGREYLNDKISTRQDLEKRSKIPLLGVVSHSTQVNNLVVANSPRSSVAETFRSLRSNLKYFTTDKPQRTILITSSVSGEGKTFCAINLASVLALANQRTLLIGVDLRKPKIFADFDISNDTGLSTYLAGQQPYEQIIRRTALPKLDVITAGPSVPNPTELLMSQRFADLVAAMKLRYDNIVFDSPPLGLVADSFELLRYADVTLYVVRQNYTTHEQVTAVNALHAKGNLQNVCLVLNDFKQTARYGYGYGYYEEDAATRPWWQQTNWKRWLKK